ncbi:MAG: hypothetical protein K2R93_19965 [Gemmatimonadaceae bacterium]|nr:hypothetical protein [Gemmatimonadaceae bacterium]
MIETDKVPSREQLQGAGILLVATLRASPKVPRLPAAVREIVGEMVNQLPPQSVAISARSRLGQWIAAAAVLESQAIWKPTWDLLTLLRERADRPDQQSRAVYAFLAARIGRVARVVGNIDDAELWYEEADALASRLPGSMQWVDAKPHALLGLCVINVGRGNYPRAAQFAQKVIRGAKSDTYRIQAYLVSALIARKQGHPHTALGFLWHAIDLLPATDSRRTDVLITMAETAADLGQPEAAVRARLAALARARTPRLAAAALGGLLTLSAEMTGEREEWFVRCLAQSAWGRALAERLDRPASRGLLLSATKSWLVDASHYGLSPDDQILMYLGAVRLALTISENVVLAEADWIEAALRQIEELARRHAFNERLFEHDALRKRLDERRAIAESARRSDDARTEAPTAIASPLGEPTRIFVRKSNVVRRSSAAATRLASETFRVALDRRALLR